MRVDDRISDAHVALGMAYVSKGLLVEGIGALKKAIELEPNRPQAHYQLAQAYKKVGKIDEAQRELEVFQKLDTKIKNSKHSKLQRERCMFNNKKMGLTQ